MKNLIEIPLFLVYFAVMVKSPLDVNFVIHRTCTQSMGYTEEECLKLGTTNQDNTTHSLEKLVQPEANLIVLFTVFANEILPAFYCFFVGSWSDKHGRKPVLLLSAIGFTMTSVIKAIISLIPSASPWFLLLQGIPNILTGGLTTFILISLCYVTDVSSEKHRGTRMGIFESVFTVGSVLGSLCCNYLYEVAGYTVVYVLCVVFSLCSLVYIRAFIVESVVDCSESKDICTIISFEHLWEIARTTLKKRQNNDRAKLLLLLSSLILFILTINNGKIIFPFLRLQLNWSLQKHTLVMAVSTVIWTLGTILGIYILHQKLKVSEYALLLVGYVSIIVSTLVQGFAINDYYIYATITIQCLGGVVCPMMRTILSKIINSEEIGKIFSVMKALESFAAIIGSTLYTVIYNSTLHSFPGAFNFFGASLFTLQAGFVISVMCLKTSSRQDTFEDVRYSTVKKKEAI